MEPENSKISVVYLVWIPYGIELFRNFAKSYKKYQSGSDHELILLFNGINNISETEEYFVVADEFNMSFKSFHKECGQDLEAYYWVATRLQSEYIFFLNSFAKIKDDNWLLKSIRPFTDNKIGAISPSGSYQSHYSSVFYSNSWKWERRKSLKENYTKYKLLIKALLYWRFLFPPFPNPHIRTNAFLIKRNLFLSLKIKKLKNKFIAYQLESGYKSITRQIIKKGYDVLIVDKKGKTYKKEDWNKQNIFWQGNQEDLLIEDKQSNLFESSSGEQRKIFIELAWGE